MSKRAKQRALEAYPPTFTSGKRYAKRVQSEKVDTHVPIRSIFIKGYEQAEKDILSKFTKEHLEGLKWIKNAGISTQPVPYHKYCKDLYKVLEELLKEKYDIQGNTSV